MEAFKAFKAAMDLKKNKKIKGIRSDRGCGFYRKYNEIGRNSRLFARFLETCGIETQYTMTEIFEQNDIAKKIIHSFIYIVRCMLSHSNLSKFLYNKALKIAVYILNQVLNKLV